MLGNCKLVPLYLAIEKYSTFPLQPYRLLFSMGSRGLEFLNIPQK